MQLKEALLAYSTSTPANVNQASVLDDNLVIWQYNSTFLVKHWLSCQPKIIGIEKIDFSLLFLQLYLAITKNFQRYLPIYYLAGIYLYLGYCVSKSRNTTSMYSILTPLFST